jgi:hypothetical protein
MTVFQQYRTSFDDPKRNHSGFGTKAASPGISPEMEAQLLRVNAYVVPRDLDERDLASHPVALRYLYLSPTQSILLSTQSCEPDELGRPGNYFAHSLIVPPKDFIDSNTPPIFYWRSSFWKKRDRSDQSVLPTLPAFNIEPSFDVEQVSTFLKQGTRASQFYKLLSAVIASSKTSRRIVIIDTAEHVALWVAALSMALPPYYRPLLSFATYHHDPYQAPFTVTGTTSSMFTPAPGVNAGYFILNVEAGTVGDVADSKYARRVTDLLVQDLFHDDLLSMFETATRRFPRPTQISDQLDQVIDYLEVLRPDRTERLTPSQLESVHQPRKTFEELPTYAEEDREELHRLTTRLGEEVRAQPVQPVVNEYAETLRVLAKRDKRAIERVPADLILATKLLMEQDQTRVLAGADLITKLRNEIFKDKPTEFSQKINSPDYLRQLTGLVRNAPAGQLLPIWRYIGRMLDAGKECQGILIASLNAATRSSSDNSNSPMTAEETELFQRMRAAMRPNETRWLQLAVGCSNQLTKDALEEFYYLSILGGLPSDGGTSPDERFPYRGVALDERVPYRQVFSAVAPNFIEVEIRNDLLLVLGKQDTAAILSLLENWAKHLRRQQLDVNKKLGFALNELARTAPKQERALASKMLLSPTLRQVLPENYKRRLLEIICSRLSFSRVTPEQMQVCREYRTQAAQISDEIDILIVGVLAMSDHALDRNEAIKLRRQFGKMDQATYQVEIEKFAAEFFHEKVSGDAHGEMVAAVYRWEYRDIFWQNYWSQFKGMLLDAHNAELTVRILGFWFDRSLSNLNDQPFLYVIQGFFLGMSDAVSDIRKEREFRQTAESVSKLASKKEWYPLVQDIFTVERRGLLGGLGRIGGLFGR